MAAGDIVFEMVLDDKGMISGVKRATVALKDFEDVAKRTARTVKESEQKYESVGHKFRSMVITFGALRFALMDINDIFIRLPMHILKTSGELERMQVLMQGLSKEATEAGKALEGLRDFNFVINTARNAPFEIGAISDSFVKLKVSGIDPTNGSLNTLLNSVAKFGGDSDVLKRATIAIQQMAGKGVISMEELRQQLGEAVPTAMKDMADGLGVTMAQLAKMVGTGTLQAGPALQAMLVQMEITGRGSAERLMETWGGATSQLKTEWMMTTKAIADSGFAEEAKNLVKELTEYLKTPEFREFARDIGSGLATLLKQLKEAGQTIAKYSWIPEYLLKIVAAVKLLGMIQSGGKWAEQLGEKFAAMQKIRQMNFQENLKYFDQDRAIAYQAHEKLQKDLAEEKKSIQEKIAAKNVELVAEKKRLAELRAIKQAEIQQQRAMNAQLIAEAQALQAKLNATKGGVALPGRAGMASRAEVQQEINERLAYAKLAEQASVNAQREIRKQSQEVKNLKREIDASNIAITENARRTSESILQQGQFAARVGASAVAVRGLAAAKQALSFGMDILGGKIGLIITALGALAYWWSKVAMEAEDSARRQANAIKGISTAEDLKSDQEQLAKQKKELAEEQRKNELYTRSDLKRASDARIAALKEQVAATEKTVAAHKKNIADDNARDAAANQARALKVELDVFKDATSEKLSAIDAKYKIEFDLIKDLEKKKGISQAEAEKRTLALQAKFNDERRAQRIKEYNDQIALISKKEAELRAVVEKAPKVNNAEDYQKLTAEQRANLESLRAMVEQREGLEAGLANFSDRGGAVLNNTKEPKTPKASATKRESVWQRELENLNDDFAARKFAVDEALRQLTSLNSEIDKAAILNREFNVRLDRVIEEEIKNSGKKGESAKTLKALLESKKSELFKQNKEIIDKEEEFNLRQKIQDGMRPFATVYDDAAAGLNTSDGISRMGNEEKKFQKFLDSLKRGGKTSEEIETQFKKLGITVGEAVDNMKFADAAAEIEKMRQASKSLAESEVGISREVIKERKLARLEDYRKEVQEKIDLISKKKGLEEQAAKDQKLLDEQVAATKKQINEDAKSSLEKLGDEWKNTAKQMEDASVNWANSTSDAILELVTTGEVSFRQLANSIIKDLARIAVQKTMAETAYSFLPMIGQAALSSFMPGNIGGPGPGYHGNAFANGGIMTSMGSLPLEKYAMGGIANSPQVAIFGEGRMNEAYVPLPDGRTIPVTLSGGQPAGDNVVISINIDNRGNETESSNSGSTEVWNGLAMKIKTVVRQEILDSQRPGGYLYK